MNSTDPQPSVDSARAAAALSLLERGRSEKLFTAAALATRARNGAETLVVTGHDGTDARTPVTAETLFDLASLTKVVVAMTAASLSEDGVVNLDTPLPKQVMGRQPESSDSRITLRQLLTHTAGLPSDNFMWRRIELSSEERIDAVRRTPLQSAPGGVHRYSCVGYVLAGLALEQLTGRPLDELITEKVLRPAGAFTARYGPVDGAVATERQDDIGRGLVCGSVHDELAWSLGRPVGNAGLFGTATDVLALGGVLANEGRGPTGVVLRHAAIRMLTEDQLPDIADRPYGQALGFRVNDRSFMGAVRAVGHTGFTGTSMVLSPDTGTVVVLLTNRVHPDRERTDLSSFRGRVTEALLG